MKRIFVSLLIALIAVPAGAEAAVLRAQDVAAPAEVIRIAFIGDQDGPPANRRNRNRDRDNGNDGGNRSDWRGGGGNFDRDNDRGNDRPRREDRSDNRINRAISIASSRGRVLDAGQQSGSVFWARVATPNGRVDLLIDTDSGRIIGER